MERPAGIRRSIDRLFRSIAYKKHAPHVLKICHALVRRDLRLGRRYLQPQHSPDTASTTVCAALPSLPSWSAMQASFQLPQLPPLPSIPNALGLLFKQPQPPPPPQQQQQRKAATLQVSGAALYRVQEIRMQQEICPSAHLHICQF